MSSPSLNRVKPLDPRMDPHREPVNECISADGASNAISEEEVVEIRNEKLEAVKKAVQDGAYDSDELLDIALARMLNAVENDDS